MFLPSCNLVTWQRIGQWIWLDYSRAFNRFLFTTHSPSPKRKSKVQWREGKESSHPSTHANGRKKTASSRNISTEWQNWQLNEKRRKLEAFYKQCLTKRMGKRTKAVGKDQQFWLRFLACNFVRKYSNAVSHMICKKKTSETLCIRVSNLHCI